MSEMALTIDELAIPAAPHAAGWDDFVAMVAVRNAVEAEAYGSNELDSTPEELLPVWQNQRYEPKRVLVARVGGTIVARATLGRLPAPGIEEQSRSESRATPGAPVSKHDTARLSVQVLPDWRRRGIGTALTDQIEALAAADGCHALIVRAASRYAPGPELAPPTGFGALPLANPEVRFLQQRGYRLEQVSRGSRLALPIGPDLLGSFAEQAAGFAGPDYIVHCWRDRTPPGWREDLAGLYSRMGTNVPVAGLQEPEDIWTAERLVDDEETMAASPRVLLTAAMRHIPSGRLVGYSQLSVPAELHRPVSQEDTLVLREHRGHRLGMLLKVAGLHYLAREAPGHPSIITFNAEENGYMIAVNEALGFAPIGFEGSWRRSLAHPQPEAAATPNPATSSSDRD